MMNTQNNTIDNYPHYRPNFTDMCKYGYHWPGMIAVSFDEAKTMFAEGYEVFCLYPDDTEGTAFEMDDIIHHGEVGGMFGVDKDCYEMKQESKVIYYE